MAYTLEGPAALTDLVSPLQAARFIGASVKTVEWWLENHSHWKGNPHPRRSIRIAEWGYQSANARFPNARRTPLIRLGDLHVWAMNSQAERAMKPYAVDLNV